MTKHVPTAQAKTDNMNIRSYSPDKLTATGIDESSLLIHQDGYLEPSWRPSRSVSGTAGEVVDNDHTTIAPSDISTPPRRHSSSSAIESTKYMGLRSDVDPTDNDTPGERIALTSFDNESNTAFITESRPLKETITSQDVTDKANETIWDAWWLETLSSLLALGCIIAIVVILSLHQGKPLPDWPALISVNSLTAIFTAVFKASLILPIAEGLGQLKWNWFHRPQKLADVALFDNASRGPWGSLLLIIKQIPRPHKSYLAGFGSLITIAALAIDPVSQAMIEHRECHLTREPGVVEVAEVPRTNNYTASDVYVFDHFKTQLDLSPTMEVALHKGLWDPEETETMIQFQCPTGDCTFTKGNDSFFFSSLAMCHSCKDITNDVVLEHDPDGHRAWHLNVSQEQRWPFSGPQVCSALRNKPKLSVTSTPGNVYRHGQEPFLSFDVLMITLPACKENASSCYYKDHTVSMLKPVAVRCSLDPLINGEERQCFATADWAPQSVRVDSTYGSLYKVGDPPEDSNLVWKSYPRECVWAVGSSSSLSIDDALKDLFNNNISTTDLEHVSNVTGPTWLKKVYAEGPGNLSTVESMIQGLTKSMTAAIRNDPGGPVPPDRLALDESQRSLRKVRGSVSSTQTCVFVHWGWIAYPAALLVLQWTFSILMLVTQWPDNGGKTRTRSTWKSSPLALLFHGLDEGLRRSHGNLRTLKDMDAAAKKLNVQLAPVDGSKDKGWLLCES
ncbi:Carboxylic ester hydrolase [Colletotrichum higginsianum IMI 349063]|uniref:Carboxylic ester hydrolase n=1 Tax=Colletotrichum higginsianum (strain IMI 349063) TaxID=759273 RepID=A0A1B7YG45_COLHI|nr:Carboxylic ester hydrolase [Colletotrichum higginsianum IMI 349063]OBR10854.1 Carboxylic ester hydrolase [Colletotrichum higginsianum IMI 349063]